MSGWSARDAKIQKLAPTMTKARLYYSEHGASLDSRPPATENPSVPTPIGDPGIDERLTRTVKSSGTCERHARRSKLIGQRSGQISGLFTRMRS